MKLIEGGNLIRIRIRHPGNCPSYSNGPVDSLTGLKLLRQRRGTGRVRPCMVDMKTGEAGVAAAS